MRAIVIIGLALMGCQKSNTCQCVDEQRTIIVDYLNGVDQTGMDKPEVCLEALKGRTNEEYNEEAKGCPGYSDLEQLIEQVNGN